MPTYHLANYVDDHLMQISHVIRGEEWLPSLALHQATIWRIWWENSAIWTFTANHETQLERQLSKREWRKMGFPVFFTYMGWFPVGITAKKDIFSRSCYQFLGNALAWNPGTEQEIFLFEWISSRLQFGKGKQIKDARLWPKPK